MTTEEIYPEQKKENTDHKRNPGYINRIDNRSRTDGCSGRG